MPKERLYLYDTTLRDGAQTPGVSFQLRDKQRILSILDDLGVDYAEGGYPGSNPIDTALFTQRPNLSETELVAFGMTRRAGCAVEDDTGLRDLLKLAPQAVCLVAKSSEYHVRVALGIGNDENLAMIRDSVRAIVATGREPILNCEHFFDGFKQDRRYTIAVAETAFAAGARWIVLCDTNGGTLPHEVEEIVRETAKAVPGTSLGIHAHDDTGQAVAVSLAAVRAGCRQVQGTLNGIGERCGNANLVTIIPTLVLKDEFATRFTTGISAAKLQRLAEASRAVDAILGRTSNPQAPYVGHHAFATKAGIHASGLLKDTRTYEHVPPQSVGNERHILVSNQSGRSNVMATLEAMGLAADASEDRLAALLDEVKQRETLGYAYDAAPASFALLAQQMLSCVTSPFAVLSCHVSYRPAARASAKRAPPSDVTMRVTLGDAASPVEASATSSTVDAAAFEALRNVLRRAYPAAARFEIVGSTVRSIDCEPPMVRVLAEARDASTSQSWVTMGVAADTVSALTEALVESFEYGLLCRGLSTRSARAAG